LPGVPLWQEIDEKESTWTQDTRNFGQRSKLITWLAELIYVLKNSAAQHSIKTVFSKRQSGRVYSTDNVQFTTKGYVWQGRLAGLTDIKSSDLKAPTPKKICHLSEAATPVKQVATWCLSGNIIRNPDVVPDAYRLVNMQKVRKFLGLTDLSVNSQKIKINLVLTKMVHL